jgi:hypothetical protein
MEPNDKSEFEPALSRALKTLGTALADAAGPSQYGLRQHPSAIRVEAKETLETLFRIESLDIYLPLLESRTHSVFISVSHLVASIVRDSSHQRVIIDWLPPDTRKTEVKGKRGWEVPVMVNFDGGWAVRKLSELTANPTKDPKVQEAALLALATLSKDNSPVSSALSKPASDPSGVPLLSTFLGLTKSKSLSVQLAACSCATNIIRSGPSASSHQADSTTMLTILHVLNRLIASPNDPMDCRTKACYVLFNLVQDDPDMCMAVYRQKTLDKLAALVKEITPLDHSPDWDEDESDGICRLREGAFTAIATLSMFDHEIRKAVTDDLNLIPHISTSISHRHVGVRYSACLCVRALSRAVAVLRTNIVDSGLGMTVFQIFKKKDEDKRVTSAALMTVCNLVNEFSPLRAVCVEQGLLSRLIELLDAPEDGLRLNSLWALKNFVGKSTLEDKKEVVRYLTWDRLSKLMLDAVPGVQEQAFGIARNIAENEPGIDLLFEGLGSEALLSRLTNALQSMDINVVLQGTYLFSHLLNGTEEQQDAILVYPQLLVCLRLCLTSGRADIRRPAVSCMCHIAANATPARQHEIVDSGLIRSLRQVADWGTEDLSAWGKTTNMQSILGYDRDSIEQAKRALNQFAENIHGGASM